MGTRQILALVGVALNLTSLAAWAQSPTAKPATTLPPLPTSEQLATWAKFAKKVTFKREVIAHPGKDQPPALTMALYSAPKQTLVTYVALIFKAESFMTPAQIAKWRDAAHDPQYGKRPDWLFKSRKTTDGRELLSGISALGPGGAVEMAFVPSSDGKYDLVLQVHSNFEDDMPEEQKLKQPQEPGRQLIDILLEYDKFLNLTRTPARDGQKPDIP